MVVACLLLAGCVGGQPASASPSAHSTVTATPAPCSAPEATQFDFYVGTWNMSWTEFGPTRFTGTDVVVKKGCELYETLTAAEFLGTPNYRATSVTAWDAARGRWVQDYRDNGGRKTYVGTYRDGQMVLESNPPIKQRLTWREIAATGFVWTFETSPDGGLTWNQQAAIDYRRA